ncbi:universal stress protein [Mycobacterium sp. SM1]|uniref:universal stress protein n=1 Tax=Mycobacterium sp. SM1 TaxID=2816243 RepID=UPI001BCC8F86|nr:universal stress protein [Mycobacterium sp. SM1]MBS4730740.1 universal stress protein [Mycobacterium sp. SM1]
MSRQPAPLGIVAGVDGSPSSAAAVGWAARDAEMRNVPLTLVHVVAPQVAAPEGWAEIQAPSDYWERREGQAREIIEAAHKLAVEAGASRRASAVTSEVRYAPVVPTLVDLSQEADMVVVGCRGQGAVARALLGSVSAGLVRHAHCPVAVIHDGDALKARPAGAPVVVGIDGSPASELATQIAFDEASWRGVELVALHAWSDLGALEFGRPGQAPIEWADFEVREQEVLAERLSGWRERYPDVLVHQVVVSDRPAYRLLEQAEVAQLVVVGSHGRGGFPGMPVGSVSRAVVNAAQIPVIVARGPHRNGGHHGRQSPGRDLTSERSN